MKLDTNQWEEFKISSLFTIYNGKGITKEEIEENEGDFTVVQSGEENNGVLGKISRSYCETMNYTFSDKPCLTVARSGSAGFVSFQINGCVVGDSAKILLLEDSIATVNRYIFLQTVLSANRFKYDYGRKVTKEKYMNDIIKLPVVHNQNGSIFIDPTKKYSDKGYVPDWQFMEEYIKSLHYKPLSTQNKINQTSPLNIDTWKEFKIPNLFNVCAGTYYSKDEYEKGCTPYVSASDVNNGIGEMIDLHPDFNGNKITIGKIGATAYYQPYDFSATSDVNVLTPKFNMNKYHGIFITQIINFSENYKWSYGRQCRVGDTNEIIIKLPIQFISDGTPFIDTTCKYSEKGYVPDWQFMEDYIKSLPYGDRLK